MKTNIKNIILLAIRLYVGYILVMKGFAKLGNMDGMIGFLGNMTGLSAPFIWAVALGEFLSGLGIIFGVWTKVAAAGASIILIGVLYYAGDYVGALPLLIGSLVLVAAGGGKWSLLTWWKSRATPIVSNSTSDLPKF